MQESSAVYTHATLDSVHKTTTNALPTSLFVFEQSAYIVVYSSRTIWKGISI